MKRVCTRFSFFPAKQLRWPPMSNNIDQADACAASLVEVWRGPIVESRHRGHLITVDGRGHIVASLGSPETITYIRSSAKPFQAIPLITSGAADRFGFTEQEIAIACGSHSGEPQHVKTVQSMLEKIGLDERALKCGTHEPFSVEAARELSRKQEAPNVLQNNCSGKHAGMLALAKHVGAPTATYDEWTNLVQQTIAGTVSKLTDLSLVVLAIGVDGCRLPVLCLPLRAMSLMYAR